MGGRPFVSGRLNVGRISFICMDFLLHQNCQAAKLKKGQLVIGVVISVDKKRGTVYLKADHKMLAAAMNGLSIEQLLPGSLVNARVRSED
ncbi:hypothetical protein R1sor_010442 [Riccia sorocarpa]|uniref:TRAM domain-containing protein n=1 Tax=Riccia sorocarpa TaxID=122646 RepID=A0ABD3HZJ1_9MARC